MKKRVFKSIGAALLLLTIHQNTNAQLVTKHDGIEPQYKYGNPFSKLIWLDGNRPLSYSGEMVTKYSISGNSIDYHKNYELNGQLEIAYRDVEEIGGYTIFNTYEYLFATDASGNPVWSVDPHHYSYHAEIQAMCASNSDEILLFQTAEKYGETYLSVTEVESATGNLINFYEFRLHIPTDVSRNSTVATANLIPGRGYFITFESSTNDAYTLSLDFSLDITELRKQEYIKDGNTEPFYIHEILPTDDGEMFFITGLNDGSIFTPNGVIIGKLDFNHNFSVVKYIEPSNPAHYFDKIYNVRALIVETEETIPVDLGEGVTDYKDAVTFSLAYWDGSTRKSVLVQYEENFNWMSDAVAYDYGSASDEAANHNIIVDYAGRIQLRVGVFDNPTYTPGVIDECYYNILQPDDLVNNCHAEGLEISETDLDHSNEPFEFGYSTDEFELREVDITHNDLDRESREDCPAEPIEQESDNGATHLSSPVKATVYPNPSTGNIFVKTAGFNHATIRVFSVTGELIRTKLSNGNQLVEIHDLNEGIYLISISDESGNSKNVKVIVL